jgi:acyl carrier protein
VVLEAQSQAAAFDPLTLRTYLHGRLPSSMVPAAFVPLDALPLSPNGKIDRRALPTYAGNGVSPASVPPRTPMEAQLAAIWAEVLRRDQVGVYDNFFDLGGHSLVAIRLIARLRVAFQMNFPMHIIFEAPTVASLAETIETLCWLAHASPESLAPVQEGQAEGDL